MGRDEFGEICPQQQERIPVMVTELIRFLDPQIINNAIKRLEYISQTHTQGNGQRINLPQKATCSKKNTSEIVYDINGYAIPTYFEMCLFKRCSLLDAIEYDKIEGSQRKNYDKIAYKFGQEGTLPTNYLLYISTLYDATINGYIHRTKQIASYDWITDAQLQQCCDVLHSHVVTEHQEHQEHPEHQDHHKNILFEVPYKECRFLQTQYHLWGRVDILDNDNNILWEIKCTSQTDLEHIIQLAIYAWMTYTKDKKLREYKLLNICSNEVITLIYDHTMVTDMIDYLLKSKYEKKKALTDTEFIADCLSGTH
jgi:hypothetical protein